MGNKYITGTISDFDKPIMFCTKENSFEFTFMEQTLPGFFNKPYTISPHNGFIFGKTHKKHSIAIYSGNQDLRVFGSNTLNTDAYILSQSNITHCDLSYFKSIIFEGGTLNTVFFINALHAEIEENGTKITRNDDSMKYSISFDDNISFDLTIYSDISHCNGTKGHSILNNTVCLKMDFKDLLPLEKSIDLFNRIRNLLSFMTFRDNVFFDKITLQIPHLESGKDYLIPATVFIRYDFEKQEKMYMRNITFEDIGNRLPNLMSLLCNMTDKAEMISLGFIPESNQTVGFIDDMQVRSVCSAIESELDHTNEKNEDLDTLISAVKKLIKDFRKQENKITNKTYDSIFSSISHWNCPLSERLWFLVQKFREEIKNLNPSLSMISEEKVKSFVKYRNDITHGRHRTMNAEIALTTHLMKGLVYCCILERIGFTKDEILEFCKNNKIIS